MKVIKHETFYIQIVTQYFQKCSELPVPEWPSQKRYDFMAT